MEREKKIVSFMKRIANELNTSEFMKSNKEEDVGMCFSITVAKKDVGSGSYSNAMFCIDKDIENKKYIVNRYDDSRTINKC